jgi:glycine/D-amino acid oxidase-like deaminating enzyme
MQVCPENLCKILFQFAVEKVDTQLIIGKVVDIQSTTCALNSTCVQSVLLENGTSLDCGHAIFCMGPWTLQPHVRAWFKGLPVCRSPRAHSLLVANKAPNDALFIELQADSVGQTYEIYSRNDGIYICGDADFKDLPPNASDVNPDSLKLQDLKTILEDICPMAKDSMVLKSQCCFLPSSPDGLPIIGAIPGLQNAYIGTGHSCWGILCGPSTGQALADLITKGASSDVCLKKFSPERCFEL